MDANNSKRDIFRKVSLDRISSPDKLNDYIRVSSPGIWIILAAIAVMLASAIFWACTAEITPEGHRLIDFLLGHG